MDRGIAQYDHRTPLMNQGPKHWYLHHQGDNADQSLTKYQREPNEYSFGIALCTIGKNERINYLEQRKCKDYVGPNSVNELYRFGIFGKVYPPR